MAQIKELVATLILDELVENKIVMQNDQKSVELVTYLFDKPTEEWPEGVMAKLAPYLPDPPQED